jgi:hypothetical protein
LIVWITREVREDNWQEGRGKGITASSLRRGNGYAADEYELIGMNVRCDCIHGNRKGEDIARRQKDLR